MAEEIRISNPVKVKSDSTERVAYELMEIISNHADKNVKKDERYYLTLYRHALRVVRGQPVETAMQDEVQER